MRIAYITPYQGPSLLQRRPIIKNRSLSNTVKIELVASALAAAGHDVEIISQGEVVENQTRLFPGFPESQRFDAGIPILYASSLPIRRLNGFWSSWRTLQLFKSRYHARPFDLMVVFNMKEPQIVCARYALQSLRLPVVLEYEDDAFVNVTGEAGEGVLSPYRDRIRKSLLRKVAGCIAVSPHLLSQVPEGIPTMLLRGAVNADIVEASKQNRDTKRNWILFSGTHIDSNGVGPLLEAWRSSPVPGWELHITGYGQLTDSLREQAKELPNVAFHGLVTRAKLVELMSQAQVCINPHSPSLTPGNVFAFKIIEYLAAGAHCVTTRMGTLEPEIEMGISYMPDNSPATIAATLNWVIENRRYERHAVEATQETYSANAISRSLSELIREVMKRDAKHLWGDRRQPIPKVGKKSMARASSDYE
jgi:hypothetical protein